MRLISMSLWGSTDLYGRGALENARAVPRFFPGWTLCVYHDDSVPTDTLAALRSEGVLLVERPPAGSKDLDALSMFWRFEPMWHPTADRFIVRDADSRLTQRDADAVQEWVDSGKAFHIIRDCESHNVTILGGTWGAKCRSIPGFRNLMRYWLTALVRPDPANPRGPYHGQDQMFLWNDVWPLVSSPDAHMAHIRADNDRPPGDQILRYTGHEIELPPLGDGGIYVGQVC